MISARSSEGNWFLIICSWEIGADDIAVQKFHDVYRYLKPLAPTDDPTVREKWLEATAKGDPDDPRLTLVADSLKSLNLIGRRKFVIICQIISPNCNKLLQMLSRMIILDAPINVEIFPATFVHDLNIILPEDPSYLRTKRRIRKSR